MRTQNHLLSTILIVLAISAANVSATVWKSGAETGFLSVLPNIILAFANNICMIRKMKTFFLRFIYAINFLNPCLQIVVHPSISSFTKSTARFM